MIVTKRVVCIILPLLLLMSIPRIAWGASSTDELGGETGKYTAQTAAPDSLTTTKQGRTLKVTGGSAAPDRADDQGKVKLTGKNGPTAVFEGRSTGWGCTYTVNGIFVGPGTGPVQPWTNIFEELLTPRIVFEINTPAGSDDLVGLGLGWTELEIRLLDGADNVTYTVSSITATGTGEISSSPSQVTLTKSSPVATVWLSGTKLGSISIQANCDNGAVVIPRGGEVVIPIKTPNGDPTTTDGANATNEVTFSAAAPGVATVTCEANRIAKDPTKFVWEITDAGATKAKWDKHPTGDDETGKDLDPKATYTGLPANNADFGAKTITLTAPTLKPGQATQIIELFFAKYALNHPGGQVGSPNWYYYWSQTAANFGTHIWINNNMFDGYVEFDVVNTIWVAHICQGASTANPNGAFEFAAGIDYFANVCRHEERHRLDSIALWGANNNRVPAQDTDNDYLPDAQEANLVPFHPYDNTKPGTYMDTFNYLPIPGLLRDCEDYCLRRQQAWNEGDANAEDWASPGMQHKTLGKYND